MEIKAVIFDLGGVLVRTEYPQARRDLARKLGQELETLDRLIWGGDNWELAQIGAITYQEYWKRVAAGLGLSTPEELSDFRREYFSGDRVDQDLVRLIKTLRKHYKIGLLSNAPDRLDVWLEEDWGIKDLFDAVVYSAKVGTAKPDPAIFRLILERLDLSPPETLFIDDYPRNVSAALELGMNAIHTACSEDCWVPLDAVIEAVQQSSVDSIAVIDHNEIDGALQLAAEAPFPVVVGEEIGSQQGEIAGLFLQEWIPPGLTARETIDRIKKQGGLVYVPHPLARDVPSALGRKNLDAIIDRVDVVEGFNARILRHEDDLAAQA
jgi:epoxide hydrolase-like predicted phosphatase